MHDVIGRESLCNPAHRENKLSIPVNSNETERSYVLISHQSENIIGFRLIYKKNRSRFICASAVKIDTILTESVVLTDSTQNIPAFRCTFIRLKMHVGKTMLKSNKLG